MANAYPVIINNLTYAYMASCKACIHKQASVQGKALHMHSDTELVCAPAGSRKHMIGKGGQTCL